MLKSLAFFLAVFAVGLGGLLLVSGDVNRWWRGSPASGVPGPEPAVSTVASTAPAASPAAVEAAAGQRPGGTPEKAPPDEINIPVYDVVKGRLEYTFRGRLDENQLRNLENIQEIKAVTLRDGVLEVPIYDEIARELPRGEHQARQFVLTFDSADYRASFRGSPAGGPARGEREREEVFLHGGDERGMGKTDDGSEFRFEELVFTIDRTAEAENYFTIRSEKPVSVENAYLRLESPNGLEGKIFKNKGLQKLEFFPPVRCYLDPRAAKLFSLGSPAQPAASPAEAPAPDGGSPAEGAASRKVAIACAGPMSFLLDTEPRTIRFQKDVSIFPLDGPIPEAGRPPPPPPSTRFDCQLLTIEVDSTVSPPQPTRAVATWEKDRVRAHHQGRVMEGDRLVWTLPARASTGDAGGDQRGEAVLTGHPTVTGAEGRIETGEVVFKLDEDRVLLRKGLTGNFVASGGKSPADAGGPGPQKDGPSRSPGAGPKGSTPAKSDPAREAGGAPPGPPVEGGLPRDWDFEAAEGELVFISADAPAPRGKGAAGDPAAERRLKRFIARASPESDLVIKSRDGGQYRLTGRTLDYDAKAGAVTIEGDENSIPRLYSGGDQGAARSIQLLADEGKVILRREVNVEIQDVRAALSRKGEPARPETAADPKNPASSAGGPVQVFADELNLRFDAEHQLLGIEARQETPSGRPATLKSLAPGSSYQLSGRTMSWDQREQVATVEGAEKEATGFASPRLEYEGGTLAAERIRFDRDSWRVSLMNHVAIRSCAAPRAAAPGSPPGEEEEAFNLRAGRAEVDLSEDLRPLGDGGCGWSRELRMVKSIHAWAPEEGAIELESKSYRGRAQEATWQASSQELHIFGEGRQEIGWLAEGRVSTLTARDIVYACARQLITLNGEVKGDLQIDSAGRTTGRAAATASPAPALARDAEAAPKALPASKKAPPDKAPAQREAETLLFNFQTGQVEAKVRENEDRLEVASLLARRNVLLWNDRYRLKLTGDELSFEKDRQELRMFSEEGRFQTLTYVQPPPELPPGKAATPAAARQPARVDQIDAREIWLWYRTSRAVPAGGAGTGVESVIVKFRDDVNATFYASDPGLLPSDSSIDQQRKWVLRSEHLGLRLSPSAEVSEKIVQKALAEGNVIFSTKDASGDNMAMAREAYYEEAQRKLTLRGDRQNPARLISGTRQFSYPEIAIYDLGESKIKWKGWDDPRPVPEGFEELRRDPSPRR